MNPGTRQALKSIIEEAEATRGHYTMRQAVAILIIDRLDRGILNAAEAAELNALNAAPAGIDAGTV